MIYINYIHLTFIDANIRYIHLVEILQIFYKIKYKTLYTFFFIHHQSYMGSCKKISLLEFSARKMFASSDGLH